TMTIAAITYVITEIVLLCATLFAVGAAASQHTVVAVLTHFLVLTMMALAALTIRALAAVSTIPAIIAGSLIVVAIRVFAVIAGPARAFLEAAIGAPLAIGADVVFVELAFAIVTGYA